MRASKFTVLLSTIMVLTSSAGMADPAASIPDNQATKKATPITLKPEWQKYQLVQLMDNSWNPVWSPDGKRVAAIYDAAVTTTGKTRTRNEPGVAILEISSGKVSRIPLLKYKPGASFTSAGPILAWHPDGQLLALAYTGKILTIDSSKDTLSIDNFASFAENLYPEHLAFSPSGEFLVCQATVLHAQEDRNIMLGDESAVLLFNKSGKKLQTIDEALNPTWAPDSKHLYFSHKHSLCATTPVADEKPRILLDPADYCVITQQADTRREGDETGWEIIPQVAYQDGSILFALEAYFKQPMEGSAPDGELVFWPDPKDKKNFRRLGETAWNPVGRQVSYCPVGPGQQLLQVERFSKMAKLIDPQTGKSRNIPLPQNANAKDAVEYHTFFDSRLDRNSESQLAVLCYEERNGIGPDDDMETKLQQLVQQAEDSKDLSVMNRAFNGTSCLLILDTKTGRTRKARLDHSVVSPDHVSFNKDASLLLFSCAWRTPVTTSVWLLNPDGTGTLEIEPEPKTGK